MKRLWLIALAGICMSGSARAVEVQEVKSPGGITAWLVEEHALPLLAVKIAFKNSGTAYDAKGMEGRTALVSALLSEGAGNLDSQAFNEALENRAIELNFTADEDIFRASLETLSEKKDEAFAYLGMALCKPRFDEAAVTRVKDQAISLLAQQEKEPGYLLQRGWQQMAFPGHPYANPELGTKEGIAAISTQALRNYVTHYLTKENILVAVVGDITPAELSKLLDANLGGLASHYAPDVTLKDITLPPQGEQKVVDADIPQTMVRFGTNGIRRNNPSYYAAYVMNQILGGGGNLNARLAQEIREKRGLAYTVWSQLDPMMHAATWEGGLGTRNEQVGNAVATLRNTLKDFSTKGASDAEVADAKQYLTGSFVLNLGSNAEIANFLIGMQLYHLGRDYLDTRNGKIAAVTTKDVNTLAKTLADPDKLLIVMVGKPNLNVSTQTDKK